MQANCNVLENDVERARDMGTQRGTGTHSNQCAHGHTPTNSKIIKCKKSTVCVVQTKDIQSDPSATKSAPSISGLWDGGTKLKKQRNNFFKYFFLPF